MAKRSTAKLIDSITTRSVTKGDGNLDLDANVLFAFDKATLTAKAKTVLAAAADEIRKSAPTRPVKIAGHTDNVGGTAYNQDLSLRRAKAVAAALRKLLPDVTFTVSGRGELDPIANNATAEGRALNRRVTITLPG
ncbi:MAG: OmpA family protein [Micropruina sp.]|nr:MAG: OmpA family protein [Micropruina sp.]